MEVGSDTRRKTCLSTKDPKTLMLGIQKIIRLEFTFQQDSIFINKKKKTFKDDLMTTEFRGVFFFQLSLWDLPP